MGAREAAARPREDRRGSPWAVACRVCLLVAPLTCAAQAAGNDAVGRKLFTEAASPPCALCHVLVAAGSAGKVGPSLDELKPDADRVARAVKQGVGVMPSYEESLTEEQIALLARYVAQASGASK